MNVAEVAAWVGRGLGTGVEAESLRLLALFACRFVFDAATLCLGALAFHRIARAYPAWNKACKKVHGKSWGSLLLTARAKACGEAHPAKIALTMAFAMASSVAAATNWVGPRAGEELAKWAAASDGRLAWELGYALFNVGLYSLLPFLAVGWALRDGVSPLGTELGLLLGGEEARARASGEAIQLEQVCARAAMEHEKGTRRL